MLEKLLLSWSLSLPGSEIRTYNITVRNVNIWDNFQIMLRSFRFIMLVRGIAKSDLASSCLSVRPSIRPHGTTRLPLDGFS
jgi:hypothetical protein